MIEPIHRAAVLAVLASGAETVHLYGAKPETTDFFRANGLELISVEEIADAEVQFDDDRSMTASGIAYLASRTRLVFVLARAVEPAEEAPALIECLGLSVFESVEIGKVPSPAGERWLVRGTPRKS